MSVSRCNNAEKTLKDIENKIKFRSEKYDDLVSKTSLLEGECKRLEAQHNFVKKVFANDQNLKERCVSLEEQVRRQSSMLEEAMQEIQRLRNFYNTKTKSLNFKNSFMKKVL